MAGASIRAAAQPRLMLGVKRIRERWRARGGRVGCVRPPSARSTLSGPLSALTVANHLCGGAVMSRLARRAAGGLAALLLAGRGSFRGGGRVDMTSKRQREQLAGARQWMREQFREGDSGISPDREQVKARLLKQVEEAIDEKLDLVSNQVAEAATGDLFASEIGHRGDLRASDQRVLQLYRCKVNDFRWRAARSGGGDGAGDDGVVHRPVEQSRSRERGGHLNHFDIEAAPSKKPLLHGSIDGKVTERRCGGSDPDPCPRRRMSGETSRGAKERRHRENQQSNLSSALVCEALGHITGSFAVI